MKSADKINSISKQWLWIKLKGFFRKRTRGSRSVNEMFIQKNKKNCEV